jgi:selenocysteine-specific elongation factor
MRVFGTAGHVDHGKSSLVRRLTDMDPDRLAEEKAREMTIDLGFAWLKLPDGEMLGIIDVPGHQDFIENMLAGVGGIDAVLFVIAADEGIMPQTREHLAIIDLLGIEHGLIILTKTDLIDDLEWLDLIISDVRGAFTSTVLEAAPILPVSSQTGAGIPALLEAIAALASELPPPPDGQNPRLPIDRVFTMPGFGTVVTGTLTGGRLNIGDDVQLQPSGLRARVRNLQTYKQSVRTALPGSRVAINLAGIDKAEIVRGDVVTLPAQILPTTLLDVRFRHLAGASRPLKHNTEVKCFTGAAETGARARVLGADSVAPGEIGWLQLVLNKPVAVTEGDRFILRLPSPAETIGGGIIVDPRPERRWRRHKPAILAQLELRLTGTPAERLAQLTNVDEPLKRSQLHQLSGLNQHEFDQALADALTADLVVAFPGDTYLATARLQTVLNAIIQELDAYHQAQPLRWGLSREVVRQRVGLKSNVFNALLERQSNIVEHDQLLKLAAHEIRLSPIQREQVANLNRAFEAAPYTPPSYTEAAQLVGADVLAGLIDLGEVVRVQADVIFSRAAYDTLCAGVFEIIDETGSVTAALLRDRFGTTRKYAVGLLEYLDTIGKTRRVGDARVRR